MLKLTLEKIAESVDQGPFEASWDLLEAYEFSD